MERRNFPRFERSSFFPSFSSSTMFSKLGRIGGDEIIRRSFVVHPLENCSFERGLNGRRVGGWEHERQIPCTERYYSRVFFQRTVRKKERREGRKRERERKNRWRSSGSRLIRLRGELETSETGRVKFTRENSGQSQIYPRSNIRFSAFRLFRSYRAPVSSKKNLMLDVVG